MTVSEDDYEVIAEVLRLADLVHGLRATRRKISVKRRNAIGDRDGWICCICHQPVDETLVYSPATPISEEHLRHLAEYQPWQMKAIADWVGEDVQRARAADSVAHSWGERFWSSPKRFVVIFERHISPLVWTYRQRNDFTPTVEHCEPVSVGGSDDDSNLAIAHRRCNVGSGDAPNRADIRAATSASTLRTLLPAAQRGDDPGIHGFNGYLEVLCQWLAGRGADDSVPDGLQHRFTMTLERLDKPYKAEREARRVADQTDWIEHRRRWEQRSTAIKKVIEQESVCAEIAEKLTTLRRRDAIRRWETQQPIEIRKLKRLRRALAALPEERPATTDASEAPDLQ